MFQCENNEISPEVEKFQYDENDEEKLKRKQREEEPAQVK